MALPLRRGAALIPPSRKITGEGADKHTRGEDGTGRKKGGGRDNNKARMKEGVKEGKSGGKSGGKSCASRTNQIQNEKEL